MCIYYNPAEKTCVRSVVAVSQGKIHHNYAKYVRLDKKQCGPDGKWFTDDMRKEGRSPVEELFESFDI